MTTYLILPLVAFLAGITNAIAGGGTFFTFPALTGLAGLSERAANITSTIGLWPGAAASVWSARRELKRLPVRMAIAFSIISVIGAIIGAVLLVVTPQRTFRLLVPWLLLFAAVIFGFSKPIARWAGRQHGHRTIGWTIVVGGVQLVVAIYGGYFGAGIGILMLTALAFMGMTQIHQMNGIKNFAAMCINGVAAGAFLFGGVVNTPLALLMAAGAVLGGYTGAGAARRLGPAIVRRLIIAIGLSLSFSLLFRLH
jgi:uncharacterized protein